MNIFAKITWKTMKQNRTRTLVTILGVALSAALFTALIVFCTSLFSFMEKTYAWRDGDYHLGLEYISGQMAEECVADGRVENAAVAEYVGYAPVQSENEDKPYLYVEAANDAYFQMMPIHLISGRMPADENEILIPFHLESNGGVDVKVGEKLTLEIGDRYLNGDKENRLYQDENPWLYDNSSSDQAKEPEIWKQRETKTYTVSGIYERPGFESYSAPGYTAITKMEGAGYGDAKDRECSVYLKLLNPKKDINAFEQDYLSSGGAYTENTNVLINAGVYQYTNWTVLVYGFAVMFGILVLLGSVSLIYSAFTISVSERTKQFGLLSSIGATKKQIRKSVMAEALFTALVGIPTGILIGIGGMGVTLHFIGDRFTSLIDSPFRVTLDVTWIAVVLAAAIAFITVLISAWRPSRRAMKVSAMEAIRQNQDIFVKNSKTFRAGKLFYRMFGMEGVLGKKYFLRSRRRYRTTIVSLTLSIILFLSVSSYSMYLRSTVEIGMNTGNYDVMYTLPYEYEEGMLRDLKDARGVEAMARSSLDMEKVMIDESWLAESYISAQKTMEREAGKYLSTSGDGRWVLDLFTFYLDDGDYGDFVRQQGLDESVYLDQETVPALVYNEGTETYWPMNGGKRLTSRYEYLKSDVNAIRLIDQAPEKEGYREEAADWITGENGKKEYVYQYVPEDTPPENVIYSEEGTIEGAICVPVTTEEIRLGDRITELPLGVVGGNGDCIVLIYPRRMLDPDKGLADTCYFKASDYGEMMPALKAVLQSYGEAVDDDTFYDLRAQEESNRNIVLIINVFSYGFIVLMTLIAIANVFNTMTTNIALRRRDFAMLASIGMSRKGIRKMLRYECILYGVRALLWGLPISFVVTVILYCIVLNTVDSVFTLPWASVAAAVICVFLVVFLSMMYALKRLEKENVADALKDDNV